MRFLDDRGRLFGYVNVLDGAVVLFLLSLLPFAGVAYRALRTSAATINSVDPTAVVVGQPARLRLTGADFKPYLQAYVAKTGQPFVLSEADRLSQQGTFLLSTATAAEIQVPDLPVGTYDLYLYDVGQQIGYRRAAFAVELARLPRGVLEATVRFVLPPPTIALIKTGDQDEVAVTNPRIPITDGATVLAVATTSESAEMMEMRLTTDPDEIWTGQRVSGRVVNLRLRVPVQLTAPRRWEYKGDVVRAGDIFSLATEKYKARGVIMNVTDVEPLASPQDSTR